MHFAGCLPRGTVLVPLRSCGPSSGGDPTAGLSDRDREVSQSPRKKNLPFRVFAPKDPGETAFPVVVYLTNLAAPRLGTVSDPELIRSFLRKGMLVVEVDYEGIAKAKGAGMYIDVMYLYRIFGGNLGVKPDSKPGEFPPLLDEFIDWDPEATATYENSPSDERGKMVDYHLNPRWVYVIPEGYTIDRNIEVSTITSDRAEIVHRMDVIHPAAPEDPVPAVLEISTSSPASDPAYYTGSTGTAATLSPGRWTGTPPSCSTTWPTSRPRRISTAGR